MCEASSKTRDFPFMQAWCLSGHRMSFFWTRSVFAKIGQVKFVLALMASSCRALIAG